MAIEYMCLSERQTQTSSIMEAEALLAALRAHDARAEEGEEEEAAAAAAAAAEWKRFTGDALVLKGKGLTSLPRAIGRLVEVKALDAPDNTLSELLQSIGGGRQSLVVRGNLKVCRRRSAGSRRRGSMSENDGPNCRYPRAVKLGEVVARENRMTSLPSWLAVERSQGVGCGEDIEKPQRNRLSSLPEWIGRCAHREARRVLEQAGRSAGVAVEAARTYVLDVNCNELISLPSGSARYAPETLGVAGNALVDLPASLRKLPAPRSWTCAASS